MGRKKVRGGYQSEIGETDESFQKRIAPERQVETEFIKRINESDKGFHFETKNSALYKCDIFDNRLRIYGEVKREHCGKGSAQLIVGIAKAISAGVKELEVGKYLLLLDDVWAYFYDFPDIEDMLEFAEPYKDMSASAMKVKGDTLRRALEILGDAHIKVWRSEILDYAKFDEKGFELTEHNMGAIFRLAEKYEFLGIRLINLLMEKEKFENGYLEIEEKVLRFMNNGEEEFKLTAKKPIEPIHQYILTHLRIGKIDFDDMLQKMGFRGDAAVKHGAYHTQYIWGEKLSKITKKYVEPTFMLEPYAGTGSLAMPFECQRWMNDIDKGAVNALKRIKTDEDILTNWDFIGKSITSILKKIPEGRVLLVKTNSPWNAKGGRADIKSGGKVEIRYGPVIEEIKKRYGSGIQLFPAVGKCMDVIKQYGSGYLAIVTPLGLFCDRTRYRKLQNALLEDFEFLEGHIHSGIKYFINKDKAVVFSIWKYRPGNNGRLEEIKTLFFNETPIKFERTPLLKNGWKTDTRKRIHDEVSIQSTGIFAEKMRKFFFMDVQTGGSELVQENIRKELNVEDLPSEFLYGLWSSIVGTGAIVKHPLCFNEANVHLPNFEDERVQEILTYALLRVFIVPDYTDGLIDIGKRKVKFGKNKRLNNGANYLFNTYGYLLPIGATTMTKFIKELRKGRIVEGIQGIIESEISERLDMIGYWDCIPLPMKTKDEVKDEDAIQVPLVFLQSDEK